jgi:hypothetical protein
MSSSALDPNIPLPPVDEDSDLVGENNKKGISDDNPDGGDPAPGVTIPTAGAGSFPVPGVSFEKELSAAVGGDGEDEDDAQ